MNPKAAPSHSISNGYSVPMAETEHARDAKAQIRTNEHVVVRCEGFRCLAYRDAEGKWRNAVQHQELPPVLEVIQRFIS
jgi:hypothetical protein